VTGIFLPEIILPKIGWHTESSTGFLSFSWILLQEKKTISQSTINGDLSSGNEVCHYWPKPRL